MKEYEDDIDEGLSEVQPKKRYKKHKLEKKVTVKHFLNKKIVINKYEQSFSDNLLLFGESIHPVYVQITFNRKTTTIKSSTNESFTETTFEKALVNTPFSSLCKRERDLIEFHFKSSYKKYLDYLSSQFNPEIRFSGDLFETSEEKYYKFLEKAAEDFDINSFIRGYSYSDHEIHNCIDSILYQEVIRLIKELDIRDRKMGMSKYKFDIGYSDIVAGNSNPSKSNHSYMGGKKVSALELLSFLEKRDSRYSELRKLFPSDIWYFTLYYGFLLNDDNPYKKLPATILDFMVGEFKEVFLSTFKNGQEKAQMILTDMETLVRKNKYYEFI